MQKRFNRADAGPTTDSSPNGTHEADGSGCSPCPDQHRIYSDSHGKFCPYDQTIREFAHCPYSDNSRAVFGVEHRKDYRRPAHSRVVDPDRVPYVSRAPHPAWAGRDRVSSEYTIRNRHRYSTHSELGCGGEAFWCAILRPSLRAGDSCAWPKRRRWCDGSQGSRRRETPMPSWRTLSGRLGASVASCYTLPRRRHCNCLCQCQCTPLPIVCRCPRSCW